MAHSDLDSHFPLRRGKDLWENNFPLRIMWYDHRKKRLMHSHDFWELVIVVSGSCKHLTPYGDYHLSAGNVFIMKPGMIHSYESVSDFALVNLLYGNDLIPMLDIGESPGFQTLFHWYDEESATQNSNLYLRLNHKLLEEMKQQINHLEMTLSSQLPGFRFHAVAQFMEILYRLSEYSLTTMMTTERDDSLQLGLLLDYIKQHYREKLSIAELAGVLFISEATLYRIFMKEFGEAPMSYINRLRVTQAQLMLLNTRESIAAIARNVGIPDSNYFAKCFRKYTFMTPRQYRREVS